MDCLRGLLVSVSAPILEVLGSIPGGNKFSAQQYIWNGVHSASWG
jgi:hypothetical protein